MNYSKILIKHHLLRREFWYSLILYYLFLILPLYRQYHLGANVPIYHFLIQTYLSASTNTILVMIGCFPFTKSILQEKQSQFLSLSLVRSTHAKYIKSHFIANTICSLLLVSLAYFLAILFMGVYAPIDISNENYHIGYKQSYLFGHSLMQGNFFLFYCLQWLLQVANTLFYLWMATWLSLFVTDTLIVSIFPLILHALMKTLTALFSLPIWLNPTFVFSPIHHIKLSLPTRFQTDWWTLLYVLFYLIGGALLLYFGSLSKFKKSELSHHPLRF